VVAVCKPFHYTTVDDDYDDDDDDDDDDNDECNLPSEASVASDLTSEAVRVC